TIQRESANNADPLGVTTQCGVIPISPIVSTNCSVACAGGDDIASIGASVASDASLGSDDPAAGSSAGVLGPVISPSRLRRLPGGVAVRCAPRRAAGGIHIDAP